MVMRQLLAARVRSAALISTCTSFSVSAKVVGDTSGPTSGPAPNALGAPGGRLLGVCAWLRNAAAAPSTPSELRARNCLRDFNMDSSASHCSLWPWQGSRRGARASAARQSEALQLWEVARLTWGYADFMESVDRIPSAAKARVRFAALRHG